MLSSDEFYFVVNDAVNRAVLPENVALTLAQREVLDAMHAPLWAYVNTASE